VVDRLDPVEAGAVSRRFGRNQRRRARDEVARLGQALSMESGLREHIASERDKLRFDLNEARRMLPAMSLALPPGVMQLRQSAQDRLEVQVFPPVSRDMCAAGTSVRDTIRVLPLRVMLAHCDRDQFAGMLHVRVRFADGQVAYAVTDESLRALGRHEDVAQFLAREMAPVLAQAISKELR
jgi:hypothetical protein